MIKVAMFVAVIIVESTVLVIVITIIMALVEK